MRPQTGLTTGEQAEFDPSFDELWAQAGRQFSLIGARSASFLSWRFRRSPWSGYRLFCLRDGDGLLLGYCVFCRDADHFFWVVDFFYRDSDASENLWSYFTRHANQGRAHGIKLYFLGNPTVTHMLHRLGFLRRSQDHGVWTYQPPPHQTAVDNIENWFLTQADFDTEK